MTNAQKHSVLIVEDERIVAMDLKQTLADLGCSTSGVASSAEEAIARVSERCPDLVLMDIRIRGERDGVETADILRRRFDVPVVFLTAHADDATLERAKRSEPYGYLVKPVKVAELRSAIEVALYRHKLEKRLRERERWFSTTLRSIADAVVTVDLAGKITFMNPAAEHLTGRQLQDAVGLPAREVVRLFEPGKGASEDTPLDRALSAGSVVQLHEAALMGSGDSRRIIADSASPVVDDGQVLGAVMVFRDVTGEKTLQKQLEFSDRLASLGTMAAGVAHEINNPLAVVVANAHYVLDGLREVQAWVASQAPPEIKRRVEEAVQAQTEIAASASRIARIVADLGTFARPPARASDEADVRRAIEWALRATANELRHRAVVSKDVGQLPLAAIDEVRLGQVLVNLLVNAAHAIAPGDVHHNEISIRARTDEGGFVVVEVKDSGSGIAPEAREHIFEPFFTTKPIGGGTGLGLSICHGIVRSAGGDISVESEVGRGSTFRVRLPVASPKPDRKPETASRGTSRRGRVLAVDDEELVLRTVQRILADHDVVFCASAAEALKRLGDGEHFDVILSDVLMPTMTGMDLYERLLERDPEEAAKVVFMTGGAVTSKIDDFLATVPNARVEKPFSVDALLSAVEAVIERTPRKLPNQP